MSDYICPPGHPHDETGSCYRRHQCRCDNCRARHSAEHRRAKHYRAGIATECPASHPHADGDCWRQHYCRCKPCRITALEHFRTNTLLTVHNALARSTQAYCPVCKTAPTGRGRTCGACVEIMMRLWREDQKGLAA